MSRAKQDKERLTVRVSPGTSEKLNNIAEIMGYTYGDRGATGELMDAIAQGNILLIPCKDILKVAATLRYLEYNKRVGDTHC